MKKFLKTLIGIAVSLTIYMSAANLFISPGFAEEVPSSQSNEAATENDSENNYRAATVITIIVIFTATAAGTAIFTYKIRRKSSDKTSADSNN